MSAQLGPSVAARLAGYKGASHGPAVMVRAPTQEDEDVDLTVGVRRSVLVCLSRCDPAAVVCLDRKRRGVKECLQLASYRSTTVLSPPLLVVALDPEIQVGLALSY